MADLDVADLMVDPDFSDAITILNRVSRTDNLGENLITESTEYSFGSVQPAPDRVVKRLPQAMQSENLFSFWVKGTIQTTAPGIYPSVLIFRGRRYQVRQTFDWSNFGQGYTEGVAVYQEPA